MRWVRGIAAVMVIGALALAGCDDPQPAGGSSPGTQDGTGEPVTELAVNGSFWHSGFKVTLGTARLLRSEPAGTPVVAIDATFQNLNTDHVQPDRRPPETMILTVGDRTYPEPASEHHDLPAVPLGLSLPGTIAFNVDDQFVLPEAVLTVGAAGVRQAVVPLGRPAGLISLEPRSINVSGELVPAADSNLHLTVEGGQVRADNPDAWQQAPAGQEYLRLRFSATNDGPGQLTLLIGDHWTLEVPGGDTVGNDLECGNPQAFPGPYSTVDGEVCFLVPAPAVGDYTLIADGYRDGALRFSID